MPLWQALTCGTLSAWEPEVAAFTAFLYGRMVGCHVKKGDHSRRGRDMDTSIPALHCDFVS
jgi:hypothetical protein